MAGKPHVRRGRNNTSGFVGVSLHRASGLWRAYIWNAKMHKVVSLGYHQGPVEAAIAYDKAAEKLGNITNVEMGNLSRGQVVLLSRKG